MGVAKCITTNLCPNIAAKAERLAELLVVYGEYIKKGIALLILTSTGILGSLGSISLYF
jgi:hypothetical protein